MSYEAIGQQVADQANWTAFANEEVRPVAEPARTLIQLRNRLTPPEPAETTLSDAVDEEPRIRPFFLGGLTKEGDIPDGSLAELTKRYLGVVLNDPNRWVNAEREGLTGDDYVAVTTTETELSSFVQTVDEQLTAILQQLDEAPPVVDNRVETVLDEPESVADVIQRLLSGVLQLTANTCPFTFFAHTTQAVTARYLTKAYPPLQGEIHDVAGSLGLQKRFVPKLADDEQDAAYTIWGRTEDDVLDRLSRLNQAVWTTFSDETTRSTLSPFFAKVPNPQEDFTRQVEAELTAENWTYPDYLPECAHPDRVPTRSASSTNDSRYRQDIDLTKAFIVEDGTITAQEVITAVNTSSVVHRRQEFDEPVSLLRYLDEVMPGVFLGAYTFETVGHQARNTPTTGVRVYHA
ncbi:hypothetical protein [Haloarcula sebkhae]|uniref:Uncharacterized protein n=2 Tax=Haloarcula sebkhae TaxID=932660 RepID=A0ACC6VR96_9EURY|nr:hypothetical protein [Haloarcula sebkhae]GGK79492.1 hypothetical protein GCM10009067_34750 [Haloarcula sebkhae]